jgi:hypothetical protein
MRQKRILIGVLALSAVGFAGTAVPALEPTALAEDQDVRETKNVKLKLPAMV